MGFEGQRLRLFGDYELDTERDRLLRGGEPVRLGRQACKVLKCLARRPGVDLSKDEIVREAWEGGAVGDDALSQQVRSIRKALGEHGEQYIITEPGYGYRFDPRGEALRQPGAGELEKTGGRAVVTEEGEVRRFEEVLESDDGGTIARVAHQPALLPAPGLEPARGNGKAFALSTAGLLILALAAGAAYHVFRPGRVGPVNAAGVKSLAVLPFKPLAPDARDEALEVGMADTLITKLSNIGVITVRPLGAVRRYGGLEQDPFDAGRQLGVEAVLDGTVQRSGDRVGVTVRLVRVADGRQLWGERFDSPFTDIFSIQDVISERVAASLKPRLTSAEERRLAKRYTENVEAYQLYLRGRHHALKRTLPETQKAISYFQQAIDLDPSYALAYAGLADANISSLAADLPPNGFLPQAKEAAEKAVQIDDALAEAHAELGFVIFWWDWDWGASERELKRALELDPNSANAHLYYAHLLSNTGRHAEALAEAKRARELDPLNLRINALEGQFLIHAGRADEALARLREALEMEPNYFLARQYAASAYIEKGMYAEAVGEARRAREISGARSNHSEAFLGYALAKSGKEAEARSVLEGLLKSSAERYVSPQHIALVYNGLGERDNALAWLERAYAQRSTGMVFLKVEPRWNNLRSDPRFRELLRGVGLTP